MSAFLGPSYNRRSRAASVQRAVNLIPAPIEVGNERARASFKDLPGLRLLATAPNGAAIRGGINTNGRKLVVAGNKLYEVSGAWAFTERGTLGTSTGWVDFAANMTQVFCTDGSALYCLTRDTNAFQSVPDYPGGKRIAVLNEYLLFVHANSGRYGWSAVGDGASLDALDFATAESSPDNLEAVIITNGQVLLPGLDSSEIWTNVGGDETFARNGSAVIEAGTTAPYSVQNLDNSVFWVGSSEQTGQGIVFRLNGYTPVRVSTNWVEEKLAGIDLSGAYAFTYQQEGSAFYVLQVPGLDTTLVYDVLSSLWHERAELVDGEYTLHRGDVHLFFNNTHVLGDAAGKLYALDPLVSENAGDVLCRDRIPPVIGSVDQRLLRHAEIEVICDKGTGGVMLLRWSDDNGANWGNWHEISLGEIGNFSARVRKLANGMSRNRVYQLRVTDAVPWSPVDVNVRLA